MDARFIVVLYRRIMAAAHIGINYVDMSGFRAPIPKGISRACYALTVCLG
jgi:hypothetical protein